MTKVFTLAHLSDPHLPMPHAGALQLLNKRATGYVNWWRNRVHLHVPEALAGIVADIKRQQPDHIALTGDLVKVACSVRHPQPHHGHPRQPRRLRLGVVVREPRPVGRLHGQ